MESYISEFFKNFSEQIISLHILSSALLTGGLCVMRCIVKPNLNMIKIPKVLYSISTQFLGKFITFAIICLSFIALSEICIDVGLEPSMSHPNFVIMVRTTEILWLFIAANMFYIYTKYKENKILLEQNNYIEAHENLELVFSYSITFSFALGLIAMYFGVILRGY